MARSSNYHLANETMFPLDGDHQSQKQFGYIHPAKVANLHLHATPYTFNEFYGNTKPVEYGFLGCGSGGYKIEGRDIGSMSTCMSSMDGRLMKLVSMATNRLVLNPFGIGDYVFGK